MTRINYSIIIPHYNIPDQLRRLLLSIPVKEDLEVIVVDDKSDKKLEELNRCRIEFESSGCRFIDNQSEEKGAGVCRNIGIEHANGRWLLFADSDDQFTEDFYDIISRNVDREEDIIFFMPNSINVDTGKQSNRHEEFCVLLNRYLDAPNEANELILRYHVVSPWSKMISYSLVEKNNIRFNNSLVANDMMFCRKIGLFSHKIAVEKDTFYIVTEREGSLTKLLGKDSYEIRLKEFIAGANYIRKHVDRETWNKIDMNGGIYIHMCIDNKLGVVELMKTIYWLKQERLAIR